MRVDNYLFHRYVDNTKNTDLGVFAVDFCKMTHQIRYQHGWLQIAVASYTYFNHATPTMLDLFIVFAAFSIDS